MKEFASTLFISDLHLEESQPAITQQFLQLLSEIRPPVEALYILGDLFEAWIGDDHGIAHHRNIIDALKGVTNRGIPIYFLCGNRDFLIGKQFLNETGCQLLQDETRFMLYGQGILVMHGDTLCTRDTAYMNARKLLRNRILQTLFLLLPVGIRKKIALIMRKKSREHTSMTSHEIMDVTEEEVLRIMEKHQVSSLVHGHTHRPGIHHFILQHQAAERIVLGAWHDYPNVLVWHEHGEKELKSL